VAIVSAKDAKNLARQLRAKQIGWIDHGTGKTRLLL
jgi:hypothetical protein